MNRREALKLIFSGCIASTCIPIWVQIAKALPAKPGFSGMLSIYNVHTHELLTVRYLDKSGGFDQSALKRLDHLFKCHFTGQIHPIDPKLILLLDTLRSNLGAHERPFELVSGYRSPEYNKLLRKKSSNVAKKSYHLKGMAADIRIAGVDLADIRDTAKRLKAGGVGNYSQFIHIDAGPVRYW